MIRHIEPAVVCDRESLALVCLDLQVYQEYLDLKVCLDQRETPGSPEALVHLDDLDLMVLRDPKVAFLTVSCVLKIKNNYLNSLHKLSLTSSNCNLIGWWPAVCEQVSLVHLVFLELVAFLDPLLLDHWAHLGQLDPLAQWDHQVRHKAI